MRNIKTENQIWCATHSAELIDEAGRDRTFYFRMSDDRQHAECKPATTSDKDVEVLRDLFGYSGYVGISRKIVFSEGTQSGADRRIYSNLLPDITQEIKIIPVGSCENLYRINRAILALLESDFARCQFYLIRDRDYMSPTAVTNHTARAEGKLFILKRYHIENYLLDDNLLSTVLRDTYRIEKSPEQVRHLLCTIVVRNSAAFLRDMVVFRFGELYQSEDCSIGSHSSGLSIIAGNGQTMSEQVLQPLQQALFARAELVNNAVKERISNERQNEVFSECASTIHAAFAEGDDNWRSLFPGRYILEKLSASLKLGAWPALQNILIDRLSKGDIPVHSELKGIFERITED